MQAAEELQVSATEVTGRKALLEHGSITPLGSGTHSPFRNMDQRVQTPVTPTCQIHYLHQVPLRGVGICNVRIE